MPPVMIFTQGTQRKQGMQRTQRTQRMQRAQETQGTRKSKSTIPKNSLAAFNDSLSSSTKKKLPV